MLHRRDSQVASGWIFRRFHWSWRPGRQQCRALVDDQIGAMSSRSRPGSKELFKVLNRSLARSPVAGNEATAPPRRIGHSDPSAMHANHASPGTVAPLDTGLTAARKVAEEGFLGCHISLKLRSEFHGQSPNTLIATPKRPFSTETRTESDKAARPTARFQMQ